MSAPAEARELLLRHLRGEDISDVVRGLVGDDPELAEMAQLLVRPVAAEPSPEQASSEAELGCQPELERMHDIVAGMRLDFDELTADVGQLRTTVEELAGALGACPVCAGAQAKCPLCRGRGQPGWIPPNPVAFAHYVVPAVRAHQYAHRRPA